MAVNSLALHDIPALSVRQPWAELIVSGRKSIEVRSWPTVYRGRIWIHAPQRSYPEEERAFGLVDLPKGQFVGSVNLCATVRFDLDRWELWRDKHLNHGEYEPGQYAWILNAPNRFKHPVPGRGQLNLFHPDFETRVLLERADIGGLAYVTLGGNRP
jgi:hypothetical protein